MAKFKTSDYNPFDYIQTQEEVIEFLQECMLDEDPSTFIEALGLLVRKHGVSDIADASGLNRENLYRVLSGKTKPRWETIIRIIKTLNIQLTPQLA